MTPDLKPYSIVLTYGKTCWHWSVIDDEGECFLHGWCDDIRDAAAEALEKLETFIQEATT
jgi:hypothetical protein